MPYVGEGTVRELHSASSLDPGWASLSTQVSVQSTPAWHAATEEAALPEGVTPIYIECFDDEGPCALLPMLMSGSNLLSMTTPYNTIFEPIIRPGLQTLGYEIIGQALGNVARRFSVTRIDSMDLAWPPWATLLAKAEQGTLIQQRFQHFGSWTENVADWETYLSGRPGALRETIRRKTAVIVRNAASVLQFVSEPDDVGAALKAYGVVYASSWKEPEPFPNFNAALLPRLARLGALRMGVLWKGNQPIAAQYWTVWNGTATVLKLAHDEAFKAQSPGTVLTAWMIQKMMFEDKVTELDFGRGDDAYKRLWASKRRQRSGVLLINPRRLKGLAVLARHLAGRARQLLS